MCSEYLRHSEMMVVESRLCLRLFGARAWRSHQLAEVIVRAHQPPSSLSAYTLYRHIMAYLITVLLQFATMSS